MSRSGVDEGLEVSDEGLPRRDDRKSPGGRPTRNDAWSADIILLDGNPAEGYWNMLRTKLVVKGEVVVVDKRLTASLNLQRPEGPPHRIEPADFESVFDCGVAGVNL